jgi:glutaminyl-tRNA synthetase
LKSRYYNPEIGGFMDSDDKKPLNERLNPNSWQTFSGFVEPSLKDTSALERFQFIRKGYFATDYE